eukprot:CAMPEP_0176134562 /NCGR_PEP_ID=MMETSP0120_2-20121206/68241_1 /TAXON_ID=160619 /ORGANISM="Kryptoperidinium foliaceum, Strain CCMP 1326" /LENGTH=445 /DNA_ID=CAMNT_0017470215 /DNA_START=151 /DNA_END=1488 /DNA_ORIENTATION=-
MATGLHARKKSQHGDLRQDLPKSPDSGGVSRYRKARNRFLPGFLRSELGYAIESVICFLGFGLFLGYFMLHHHHRKVVLQVMSNPMAHAGAALNGRGGFRHHFYSGHPRTVTVVMPSVVNPKGRQRRLDSIFETWGPAARAVYVVHNVSEFPQGHHAVIGGDSDPEDPYSYPQLLLVPPSISFDEGLPRLNYVIRSVYEKINPDFAFFVNDHTFVIPEHLCKYLEMRNPSEDMYEGHAMKNSDDVFNSGAAGYILSRETMKKLVQKWDEGDPNCVTKGDSKWLQGNPGLATTKCLKDSLGVVATDTRHHNKWHRFHAFPLTRVVSGAVDDWFRKKHEDMDKLMKTDKSYNTVLDGADCCAADSISFHYVEFRESMALFAAREALLKNPHMSDHEVRSLMMAEWPRDRKEIGGYSKGLPKTDDKDAWKALVATMRKISSRNTQREC